MSPALAAALLLPATLCFMVGVFFGNNIVAEPDLGGSPRDIALNGLGAALGFAGAAISMFAAVITGLEFIK